MNHTGIYIHIPFCTRKCPYCDFYSVAADEAAYDRYTAVLCRQIEAFAASRSISADTVYFGGGTPGLIGAKRLTAILDCIKQHLLLCSPEVTAEINPSKEDLDFELLRKSGFNRISIGLQSADDGELRLLGRIHNTAQAQQCIRKAQAAGFDNISLDLMLAISGQTKESLERSIDFCAEHDAAHVSAYILKIEPGTPYSGMKDTLSLPDDDQQAELYLFACERLEEYGYQQYEISNFAKPGRQSRHNLKYWHDEPYIGFGPSAHSFYEGRRFYCSRSFEDFYQGVTVDDGQGGDEEEYIMLALRLNEGLDAVRFRERFGREVPQRYYDNARRLLGAGVVRVSDERISLTRHGFLVSNAVIARILES